MFGAETSGLPKEVCFCISKQGTVAFHRALFAGPTHTKAMHVTAFDIGLLRIVMTHNGR